MLYAAGGVLLLVCLFLTVHLLRLRHQLRHLTEELDKETDFSYNPQLSVPLFDSRLSALTAALNRLLDHQRHLKRETVRNELLLRQSVSDIAHDLRTPMTVIKGNLQLLAEEPQLSQQGREHLTVCREKTDALKEMADTFFEMSVLESDSTPAELRRTDLTKALMDFFADSEAVIRLHHLEPEISLPEKSVYVKADGQMLLRMLGNLLSNVIKYAENSFTVTLEEHPAECRITFANAVPAGQEPDPQRLFERSYRADSARSGGSAGLGLYIVRLLAEKQNIRADASYSDGILRLMLHFPAEKSA